MAVGQVWPGRPGCCAAAPAPGCGTQLCSPCCTVSDVEQHHSLRPHLTKYAVRAEASGRATSGCNKSMQHVQGPPVHPAGAQLPPSRTLAASTVPWAPPAHAAAAVPRALSHHATVSFLPDSMGDVAQAAALQAALLHPAP